MQPPHHRHAQLDVVPRLRRKPNRVLRLLAREVYDKLTSSKGWGRYFERLTRHEDGEGATVFLARNSWDLQRTISDFPALRFSATRERA